MDWIQLQIFCFAPTPRAEKNLSDEGKTKNTLLVGDTLIETAYFIRDIALSRSDIISSLKLEPNQFILVTSHRKENVDNIDNARDITSALLSIDSQVVYPMHPRTQKMYTKFGLLKKLKNKIRIIEPVGYLDFITLINYSKLIMTDSGGVQQEAAIFDIPCLTLRRNTEWIETVESGKNELIGTDKIKIIEKLDEILSNKDLYQKMIDAPCPFKIGAANKIVNHIEKSFKSGSLLMESSNFLLDGLPK